MPIVENGIRIIDKLIFENNKFGQSVDRLEKYYRLQSKDGRMVIEMGKNKKETLNPNLIVELIPREDSVRKKEFTAPVKAKLQYLKNWSYVRPLFS